MPTPFDSLDAYRKARARVPEPDGFAEAKAMAYDDEPDQRDCGGAPLSGFLGPTGLDTRGLTEAQRRAVAPLDRDVTASLARAFTPVDRLSEASARRVDGPLRRPPDAAFQVARALEDGQEPTPEERADLDALAAVLRRADSPQVRLHHALRRLVHAANCFGRAYLRPYVPQGRYVEDGRGGLHLPAADLEEALSHVFLEVVLPDVGAVVRDADTGDGAAVVLFPAVAATGGAGGAGDGPAAPASAEVSYPDRGTGDPPLTVHRLLAEGREPVEVRLPLRGRPLLVELADPAGPFLDRNARQVQKALNTASTQKVLVQTEDSLRTRFLLGAQPPGHFEDGEGGEKVFVEDPWDLPLGSIAHVSGQEVYDPERLDRDGQPVVTGLTSPRLAEFTAADAERYQKDVEARTLQLRDRTKQAWVQTTGEAGVSGVSREVAMSDYVGDAEALAALVEEAGETALELMADLAAYVAGEPARFYPFAARVSCTVTGPPPSPEDRRVSVELGERGVWTMARVRAANGVDDPVEEGEAVRQEATDAERLARAARVLREAGAQSATLGERLAEALLDEAGVDLDEGTRRAIADEARQSADRAAQRGALDDLLGG